MKVAINSVHGGFNLSPLAIKRYAEKTNKECYFFELSLDRSYKPLTLEQASKSFMWSAYSVPNPQDYRLSERDEDGRYKGANERAAKISLHCGSIDRSDPNLISVIEELGSDANGTCANLKIVEIPDDIEWEIEEYDGLEWVAEKHRTWD